MEATGHSIKKLHIKKTKPKKHDFQFDQESTWRLIKEVLVSYIIKSAGTKKSAETFENCWFAGLFCSYLSSGLSIDDIRC